MWMYITAANRTGVELQTHVTQFSICCHSKLQGVSSFGKGIKAPLLIVILTSTCTKIKRDIYQPANVKKKAHLLPSVISANFQILRLVHAVMIHTS